MLRLDQDDHHHHFDGNGGSFDRLSDDLLLLIFNKLSDTKSLTRCRSVSKRFDSLVPQSENLLVEVDCVLTTETPNSLLLFHLLRSLLHRLISPKCLPYTSPPPNSPSQILRGFQNIKRLEIELPSGDLQLEKGIILKWKAQFGKSLKSCVILVVRDQNKEVEDGGSGLKLRVVWTISALIAASSRHYLLREVIREHKEIESLVLRDKQGEGRLEMDDQGLKEFRQGEEEVSTVGWKNRTTVPAVRMRMRHVSNINLPSGLRIKGATLVIVKPTGDDGGVEEVKEDDGVVNGVFDGVLGEVVRALLKRPSYLLEMNSF